MTNITHRILPILMGAILWGGCEKEIDFNLKSSADKPVVYAFMQPDSAVTISVTKSVSTLTPSNFAPIDNATIHFYKNGTLHRVLSYNGAQQWNNYPTLRFAGGDTVAITLFENEKEIAVAGTYIPHPVQIAKVDTFSETRIGDDGFWAAHINLGLTIDEPAETNDYYQLQIIQTTKTQTSSGTTVQTDTLTLPQTDNLIFNTNQTSVSLTDIDFEGLFTDANINGKQHRIRLSFNATQFRKPTTAHSRQLDIRLYRLSEAYYNYYKAQIIATALNGLSIFNPVEIPTNVSNGYGLVTGYATSSIIFDIQ
ncbi:MAG: DUF4249 domain-containing protein [Marinilabiliaceae bacterium]|nr:DUF4249 domain-containing protein [Marinilabiliaceae bacterium]